IRHFSEAVAHRLGQTEREIQELGQASLLHDLGKLGIPDAIIRKPGKLTAEEFNEIKTHPALALHILGDHPRYTLARQIAYSHHEKWDGNGYPQGLKGEEIPLSARIVAITDVFDALTSVRPYKTAWTLEATIDELKRCRGSHFDPQLIDVFIELYEQGILQGIISRFPSGESH
ncbi:MAG: HD-GYP domain-containing protein, partial [Magnetococcales bacterium]|nr:HD-GYP domain-containing protein [Magnetococcales bacterium]